MNDIKLSELEFKIESEIGKIIGLGGHTSTETNIHGGGGYTNTDIFGYTSVKVSPINVSTITFNSQDIHYKDRSGKEQFIRIHNLALPLREEQDIELLYTTIGKQSFWLSLKILNLQRTFDIANYDDIASAIFKIKNRHSLVTNLSGIISLIVIGFIIYFVGISTASIIWSLLISIIVFFFSYSKITKSVKSFIKGQLEVDINNLKN